MTDFHLAAAVSRFHSHTVVVYWDMSFPAMMSQNVYCEKRLSPKHFLTALFVGCVCLLLQHMVATSPRVATWYVQCRIREVSACCCHTVRLCDHMQCRWILRQTDFSPFQLFCPPLQILTALHQQSNITISVMSLQINLSMSKRFLSIRLTENVEPILIDFVIHVMVR